MKILIFGVTGNTGRACADYFKGLGFDVCGVARRDLPSAYSFVEMYKGDITDKDLFEKLPTDIDLVINLAGVQPSILKTSEHTDMTKTFNDYINVNIVGVFNVLEFVRKHSIPTYVYATTHRDYEDYWTDG